MVNDVEHPKVRVGTDRGLLILELSSRLNAWPRERCYNERMVLSFR
jgi:hypothetical protein